MDIELFFTYVNKTETCWLWTGQINKDGYGIFRHHLAHRQIYAHVNGEIPKPLVTDHLCRVRHCVNPDHMEAVTIAENIRRGIGSQVAKLRHQAVTACPLGHPYSPDNLYLDQNKDGYVHRKCKTCTRERRRVQYEREKELRLAGI